MKKILALIVTTSALLVPTSAASAQVDGDELSIDCSVTTPAVIEYDSGTRLKARNTWRCNETPGSTSFVQSIIWKKVGSSWVNVREKTQVPTKTGTQEVTVGCSPAYYKTSIRLTAVDKDDPYQQDIELQDSAVTYRDCVLTPGEY